MEGLCCRDAAPGAATNCRSATKELSGLPKRANSDGAPASSLKFPKSAKILRTADYRTVYDQGFRVSNPLFAAFCLARESAIGPRLGVTTPRALGGAVIRNRL